MEDSSDIDKTLDRLQATDSGTRAPTREQWRRHLEGEDKPFVVVNLLNLADQDALNQYAAVAVPKVQALGAELIYMGRGQGVMIGEDEDGCDIVSIWHWPSRDAWTALWTDPDYAKIRPLFNDGVRRYRCIDTSEFQPR
ncbi:MAG: DUF1330 domain-containing protein [Pseudomonadota bacterium]